ncbi:RecA-family ATPase [Altererythrobacter xiamenensis]|uniref:RecA-family ATPase n=1 Tax=Altererythrobacter xiamenensis TaxID=1316679 RepID=A0A1Y6FM51_9SPHN|nr:AAA family ATPase [Altererythrobacter xiamenensis]SMQ74280.1 RecA-family ATPase [Altererythrobacter xiamenensis]
MSDFAATAQESERLQALAESYREPLSPESLGRDSLLPLADLASWANARAKPKAHLWAGRIAKDEVAKLDGPGGSNKSTAGHQLVICRAAGLPFLGEDVEPGNSIYATAEDDFDRLQWVHERQCANLGIDPQSLVGKVHLSSVRGRLNNELATFDGQGRIEPTRTFEELKDTIDATGSDLVVLDNVAHLFTGNENDRAQVTAFINLLYSLKVTVLLVGHPNKSGDTYSGSTAWLNAVRSQLVIEKPDPLDPDARLLRVGKANYARSDTEIRFRWHDFSLWLDDEMPDDYAEELAKASRAASENEAFLACLRKRAEQGDGRHVGATPGPNYAPTQFEGMTEAKGLDRQALRRAMERLFTINAIETHTHRNTAKGRDVTIIREVKP